MTKSLTAVFDGEVLRPEGPVDLQPNVRYRLILEQEAQATTQSAWDVLDQLTGAIEEPEDWASEHDHYLYGTPKHRSPSPS
jgi:hypothetical protein